MRGSTLLIVLALLVVLIVADYEDENMPRNGVYLVLVALFWGATNPLIKSGTKGIKNIKAKTRTGRFFKETKYLFTNWRYLLPLGLNQLGSIVYFFALQHNDLSVAVPVTNSLTFVFTAVAGWFFGEQLPTKRSLLGLTLVVCGTTLCVLSR